MAPEMKTRLGQGQNQVLLQETQLINPPHDLGGHCCCARSKEPSSWSGDGTQSQEQERSQRQNCTQQPRTSEAAMAAL